MPSERDVRPLSRERFRAWTGPEQAGKRVELLAVYALGAAPRDYPEGVAPMGQPIETEDFVFVTLSFPAGPALETALAALEPRPLSLSPNDDTYLLEPEPLP